MHFIKYNFIECSSLYKIHHCALTRKKKTGSIPRHIVKLWPTFYACGSIARADILRNYTHSVIHIFIFQYHLAFTVIIWLVVLISLEICFGKMYSFFFLFIGWWSAILLGLGNSFRVGIVIGYCLTINILLSVTLWLSLRGSEGGLNSLAKTSGKIFNFLTQSPSSFIRLN